MSVVILMAQSLAMKFRNGVILVKIYSKNRCFHPDYVSFDCFEEDLKFKLLH